MAWLRTERWKRKYVKLRYGRVFTQVSDVLFRHDPIGIAFDNENTDEYDPEAGTIIPRLSHCQSALDVRRVVFEEFCRWFSAEDAGSETRFDAIAEELWRLWSNRQS